MKVREVYISHSNSEDELIDKRIVCARAAISVTESPGEIPAYLSSPINWVDIEATALFHANLQALEDLRGNRDKGQ